MYHADNTDKPIQVLGDRLLDDKTIKRLTEKNIIAGTTKAESTSTKSKANYKPFCYLGTGVAAGVGALFCALEDGGVAVGGIAIGFVTFAVMFVLLSLRINMKSTYLKGCPLLMGIGAFGVMYSDQLFLGDAVTAGHVTAGSMILLAAMTLILLCSLGSQKKGMTKVMVRLSAGAAAGLITCFFMPDIITGCQGEMSDTMHNNMNYATMGLIWVTFISILVSAVLWLKSGENNENKQFYGVLIGVAALGAASVASGATIAIVDGGSNSIDFYAHTTFEHNYVLFTVGFGVMGICLFIFACHRAYKACQGTH